jgi:hypothetical protein
MSDKFFEAKFGSLSIKFYALTIGQIQDLEEEMKAMMRIEKGANPFEPTRFAKMAKVYTASARRGDSNITIEQVTSVVDLDNMLLINDAVMGRIGKDRPSAAERAEAQGDLESLPVPTSPLNGGSSTRA